MAKESKVQRNYRLPVELVERIQSHAASQGISETEAASRLLARALESEYAVTSPDQRELDTLRMLGDHIRDLREQVATLRGQLIAKDEQIANALQIASNAQLLEGVHVAGQMGERTEDDSEPGSVWERLWARVGGRK